VYEIFEGVRACLRPIIDLSENSSGLLVEIREQIEMQHRNTRHLSEEIEDQADQTVRQRINFENMLRRQTEAIQELKTRSDQIWDQDVDRMRIDTRRHRIGDIMLRNFVFLVLIGLVCVHFYFLYLHSCVAVDQDRKIRNQAQGHEDVREALRTERLSKWNPRISKLATLPNEESILEQIIALLDLPL
jgi:hypothetical protein